MRYRLDYMLNGSKNYIIVEGSCNDECLEKAFIHLEEIGIDDAEISKC